MAGVDNFMNIFLLFVQINYDNRVSLYYHIHISQSLKLSTGSARELKRQASNNRSITQTANDANYRMAQV